MGHSTVRVFATAVTMNIRDLRIGQRLTLGFGLVIALLMLLAALAVARIQGLNGEISTLVGEVYPRTELALSMKNDLHELSRSMLSVLVMNDADQIKSELAVLSARATTLNKHLDELKGLVKDEEELKLITRIGEMRDKSLKQQKTFVGLIEEIGRAHV